MAIPGMCPLPSLIAYTVNSDESSYDISIDPSLLGGAVNFYLPHRIHLSLGA